MQSGNEKHASNPAQRIEQAAILAEHPLLRNRF